MGRYLASNSKAMHDDVVSGSAGAATSKLHITDGFESHPHIAKFHEAINDGGVGL